MKTKIFLAIIVLCFALTALADAPAERFYSGLEHRLHSLKSLEIRYEAVGPALPSSDVQGKMVWLRPDRFYHLTPEWTLCEIGDQQWRYLKSQNTLIRESIEDRDALLPENVLFAMRKDVRAESLTENSGISVLILKSTNEQTPGEMIMEFRTNRDHPDAIIFRQADGSQMRYEIRTWTENIAVNDSIFVPPQVPPENLIDFRADGKK